MSWFRRKPKPPPEQWFVEVVFQEPVEAAYRFPKPMSKRDALLSAAEMNESNTRLIESLRGNRHWFRAVKEGS
ncbi:hypothetical protein [Aeromicrobium piscarium]|uniref:Uncharacterized protein n=1 Tax=Aeromicrobium piscarium TaxID=2590901 RepID=A0A554SP01_9ACTN|nr:hypothetical protein [Aeromicrobium piscarium]TSD68091.1 hypothetical protein FNM00_00405 [Aeromicrobium piscarium]